MNNALQTRSPSSNDDGLLDQLKSDAYRGSWAEVVRGGRHCSLPEAHLLVANAAMELGGLELAAEHAMAALAEARAMVVEGSHGNQAATRAEFQSWLLLCQLGGLGGDRAGAATALTKAWRLLPSTNSESSLRLWLAYFRATPYRFFGDLARANDAWIAALLTARALGDPFHQAQCEIELRLVNGLPLTPELTRWSSHSPRHRALVRKLSASASANPGLRTLIGVGGCARLDDYRARSIDWLASLARTASSPDNQLLAEGLEREIELCRSPQAFAVLKRQGLVVDVRERSLIALGPDSPRLEILIALAGGDNNNNSKPRWSRSELSERVWGVKWVAEEHASRLDVTLRTLDKAIPGAHSTTESGDIRLARPGLVLEG